MDRTKRFEVLEAEYQLFVSQRDNTLPSKPRIAAWGLVPGHNESVCLTVAYPFPAATVWNAVDACICLLTPPPWTAATESAGT